MPLIRLIAADMDGTLLTRAQVISQPTIDAIKRAYSMGVDFIAATGRSYTEAKMGLESAGIECDLIVLNGSEIRSSSGEVLQSCYFDIVQAQEVLEYMECNGLLNEIYSNEDMYTTNTAKESEAIQRLKIRYYLGQDADDESFDIETTDLAIHKIIPIDSIGQLKEKGIPMAKLLAYCSDISLAEGFVERISKAFPKLSVAASSRINVEISMGEANKGSAVKRYSTMNGYTPRHVMTLGDNLNDYSMMSGEFGITVAMGNACKAVKDAARYETANNETDGVAIAINHMLDGIYKVLEEEK